MNMESGDCSDQYTYKTFCQQFQVVRSTFDALCALDQSLCLLLVKQWYHGHAAQTTHHQSLADVAAEQSHEQSHEQTPETKLFVEASSQTLQSELELLDDDWLTTGASTNQTPSRKSGRKRTFKYPSDQDTPIDEWDDTAHVPESVTGSDNSDDDSLPLLQLIRKKSRQKSLKQKTASKILKKALTHKVIHTCKICKKVYTHGTPFRKHLFSHDEGGVCCKYCKEEFFNYALVLHHKCKALLRRGRKGVVRFCHYCSTRFTNRKKLTQHLRLKHCHRSVELTFFCRYCSKGFERRAGLFSHFKEHAGDKLVCGKCGEFLPDQDAYKNHQREHELAALYMCDSCGATFMHRQRYIQHLDAHHKFVCDLCPENYGTSKKLKLHQRRVHQIKDTETRSSNKYVCSWCEKTFQRPGLLAGHMRLHTGQRPVECEVCRLHFRTNKALIRHRQSHTHRVRCGQTSKHKDYLCNICGNAYYRKQSLQRHLNYHTGALPYSCPHCPYRAREHTNLKRHITSHFPLRQFVCETCGKSFQDKNTLATHKIYKHTDQKDFICQECGKAFKTAGSLRRHEKTHSSERPWKCPSCDKAFIRLYTLRRHVTAVHHTSAGLPPIKKIKLLTDDVTDIKIPTPPSPPSVSSLENVITTQDSGIIWSILPGDALTHQTTAVESDLLSQVAASSGLHSMPLTLQVSSGLISGEETGQIWQTIEVSQGIKDEPREHTE